MTNRDKSFASDGNINSLDKIGRYLSKRKVSRAVGITSDKNILDLGCGFDLGISIQFQENAGKIYAVDLLVDSSLLSSFSNIEIIEGYIPEVLTKLPMNEIDIIIANNILEHLNEPKDVLRILHSRARKDFTFYYNVPSWLGRYALEFAAFRLKRAPREEMVDHKRYYGKKDLWQLLVDAGMSPDSFIVKSHKFGLNTYAVRREI
jgi:SAM-dependent methyltransferase